MKLIFIGSGAFAIPALEALKGSRHELEALFAQPDKPAGRGHALRMPKTKPVAERLGIVVHQPPKIRAPEAIALIRELAPEIIVVVAYGQIIPRSILDVPPQGIINVHGSLLPAYRGAAPIQWAIARGETETGVTTMQMDEGLDTGPVLLSRKLAIEPGDTTASLEPKLAELGAQLLLETLERIDEGSLEPIPQDDDHATLAPRIKKENARIEWSWPANRIERYVRAFQPWPVAYAEGERGSVRLFEASPGDARTGDERPGTILSYAGESVRIACGNDTVLELHQVQAAGKARMSAAAFARGRRLAPGELFR